MTAFLTRNIVLTALAAGFINFLPRLLAPPGADAFMQYALIDCFSRQLWQGELYPRWCMEANAGLGSPMLFVYFPVTYYITALLYPLHALGVDTQQQYLCGLWLACSVTFYTCYLWLKDIVTPGRALLGAFLFLWLPYRMDVLLFRSAYTEVWGIAFMPLLLMCVRRFMVQDRPRWLPVVAAVTLCLFTHAAASLNMLLGCGLYSLIMAGRHWRRLLQLGLAVVMALALTAVYILPAHYFLTFFNARGMEIMNSNVWASGFITMADFYERTNMVLALAVMWLFALMLAGFALWRRRFITDPFVRREIVAWMAVMLSAVFMAFGISRPVWTLLTLFAPISAPWRMQLLIMFAATYFFAVAAQWLAAGRPMKTWKTDYAAVCGLFVLLALLVITGRPPGQEKIVAQALQSHIIMEHGFTTRWTDYDEFYPLVMNQADPHMRLPAAQILSGRGEAKVIRWDVSGIRISADMATGGVLRPAHFYFPIWHALIDGKPAALSPQSVTGLMLLDVPAGKHDIILYRDMNEGAPASVRYAPWISAAALCACAAIGLLQRWRRAAHG